MFRITLIVFLFLVGGARSLFVSCGSDICDISHSCYDDGTSKRCVRNCYDNCNGSLCIDRSAEGLNPECVSNSSLCNGQYCFTNYCYEYRTKFQSCLPTCETFRDDHCHSGESCIDKFQLGMDPVCETSNCGNEYCNVNETCYRNSSGYNCIPTCRDWVVWSCPRDSSCVDRSDKGMNPICEPNNCGAYYCNINETCYTNTDGYSGCIPNCKGWDCQNNETCFDRSDEGKKPICETNNCDSNFNCTTNEICYKNAYGSRCIPTCEGWACNSGETCVDRSDEGMKPICETNNCGNNYCNVNETCYRNSSGYNCIPNCRDWVVWSCPRDSSCVDRSDKGMNPICEPNNCGAYYCNINETCYTNTDGYSGCIPNCKGWDCQNNETCFDRSDEGKKPICETNNCDSNFNCTTNEICYKNAYGSRCIPTCEGWACNAGETCVDRSDEGMKPICETNNCGNNYCNVNETCYRNSSGYNCIPTCRDWVVWSCPRDSSCVDRSDKGMNPICEINNCGAYYCNINETCYTNTDGYSGCIPNCKGWDCQNDGKSCVDRSDEGKKPICETNNCGSNYCSINETCYRNNFGYNCIPTCVGWDCDPDETCVDRSDEGMNPICETNNCGNNYCNFNESCYRNSSGYNCIPNCRDWSCPVGTSCVDRSDEGMNPICETNNCGSNYCSINETCYRNNFSYNCIPTCVGWDCDADETCVDRSDEGMNPICEPNNCGNNYCNFNESCYRNSSGYNCIPNCRDWSCPVGTSCVDRSDEGMNPICETNNCGSNYCSINETCYRNNFSYNCIPTCVGWDCDPDETCVDRSDEGMNPICEPNNCGNNYCNFNESCYRNSSGYNCIPNCRDWSCPVGTSCVDRSDEGMNPICETNNCGNNYCSINETCYRNNFSYNCIPTCVGWDCDPDETCVDRSDEGMNPICEPNNCGNNYCNFNESCYRNSSGYNCIPNCRDWSCPVGTSCVDRSDEGMNPICETNNCGNNYCSINETCYRNNFSYNCIPTCVGWDCDPDETCVDRSDEGMNPICEPNNCGNNYCNFNESCYRNSSGYNCIPNCRDWSCPVGTSCVDRSDEGMNPICETNNCGSNYCSINETCYRNNFGYNCIPTCVGWDCDLDETCVDRSDEGMNPICEPNNCGNNYCNFNESCYRNSSGYNCIPNCRDWSCPVGTSCVDRSDEGMNPICETNNCGSNYCSINETCYRNNFGYNCIPTCVGWDCDADETCVDRSDEGMNPICEPDNCGNNYCNFNESCYRNSSGYNCIPNCRDWSCPVGTSCVDRSDEGMNPICETNNCGSNYCSINETCYRNNFGYNCIPTCVGWDCDADETCVDRSDEGMNPICEPDNCGNNYCNFNESCYRNSSGYNCIPNCRDWSCPVGTSCVDRSDEGMNPICETNNCGSNYCSINETCYRNNFGYNCIPTCVGWDCDADETCVDRSDEGMNPICEPDNCGNNYCNFNESCYRNSSGYNCIPNCRDWSCPVGTSCVDRSDEGMNPICETNNCGGNYCSINETCYRNNFSYNCIPTCVGWDCDPDETCVDRSDEGMNPICEPNNCGNNYCNFNESCYRNSSGYNCIPNCRDWSCPVGTSCVDRSDEGMNPICETNNCGNNYCSINETCYRNNFSYNCIPTCVGWDCDPDETCVDRSDEGMNPICEPDNCGNNYCNFNESCYRNSSGYNCIPNCRDWSCPVGTSCVDRSDEGMNPICETNNCGSNYCSINETCYRNNFSYNCIPTCVGWDCDPDETCVDRSDEGMNPICEPNNCGNNYCNTNESCYRNSSGSNCIPTCRDWSCPVGTSCVDRSDEGMNPICEPDNCGNNYCNFNESCYRNSSSYNCNPTCRGWLCPVGKSCVDRSDEGMNPICETNNCGSNYCNINETCYRNNSGYNCIPTCESWDCDSNETCVDRSDEGMNPICEPDNCGNNYCNTNESCYRNSSGYNCIPNCESWSCPVGKSCVDRSDEGMDPVCEPNNCGNNYCNTNESCTKESSGRRCIHTCDGWVCNTNQSCVERVSMNMNPLCVGDVKSSFEDDITKYIIIASACVLLLVIIATVMYCKRKKKISTDHYFVNEEKFDSFDDKDMYMLDVLQ